MMAALPATLSLHDRPEPVGGAEADIFRVRERDGLLVKLFKAELMAEREAVIRTLCARAGQPGVAWPVALRRFHQRPGLVLPKIAGQELHVLTSRVTRLVHFPDASWRLCIAAARSYAEACAAVHAANLAIVDVSSRNALVDARGTVTLIDADSFLPPGGTAAVATEEYQAPETLGRLPLRWQVQYDLHGIALILFELLFQKASPWPRETGEARGGFRFRQATRAGLQAWEVGLDDLTPRVAALFTRAFGSPTPQPPRASEWAAALLEMERLVRPCARVPTHAYVSGEGRACPWCACAARPGGKDVFRSDGTNARTRAGNSRPPPVAEPVRPVEPAGPTQASEMPAYAQVIVLLAAVLLIAGLSPSRVGDELRREVRAIGSWLASFVEDPENRQWEQARTGDFASVETFLRRHPAGKHADVARARLAALAPGLPLAKAPRRVSAKVAIRLRNAPSLTSEYKGYVRSGSVVRPVGSVLDGRWYVLQQTGSRAYVAAWLTRAAKGAARRRGSSRSGATPRPHVRRRPAAERPAGSATEDAAADERMEFVEPTESVPPSDGHASRAERPRP